MKDSITIEEARDLLKKYLKEEYLIFHSIETEAIMRALAKHFAKDEEFWGITGLLHDLDYEETKDDFDKHGARTCEILTKEGYDIPEMFHAIKSHCENLGSLDVKRESELDFCLSAAENMTGLIVAYALVRPEKKIAGAKVKSLTKKFKDKSFAAKVNRGFINDIEKVGLQRSDFFQLSIDAMTEIADEVGL